MTLPNLNHLKYFTDAVELGSISAAAQRNLVTHPAISRAISSLEHQLGIQLLVHKKKSFEVTPTGFLMAEKAKRLLAATDSFNTDNLDLLAPIAGMITIGVSRTLGLAYLGPILKVLAARFPKIKVHVRFGTTGELIEKVTLDAFPVALTIGHQPRATLQQSLLHRGQFLLIRSAKKTKFLTKDLLAENFILTEPRPETELLKKQFQRKFKSPLSVLHEVESWDMIAHLVGGGIGLGLIPDIGLSAVSKKDIVAIRPEWFECPYEIYLHQSKTAQRSSVCRALTEIIESEIKTL